MQEFPGPKVMTPPVLTLMYPIATVVSVTDVEMHTAAVGLNRAGMALEARVAADEEVHEA